ncbi:type VII secretion-associated protein [Mycolicibacterium sp.]|uniref:type VII secretion-associated protein n=1 Tax=Mycolicibacterium sp. TaxID=2320850 RepID=UPI001A25A105|nr:type VII secretion-associated protein [Mycolicibacterium sp.]MBJ7337265.1 type VII secretion-associated protein [Mycolicibacterium sp.]
MDRPAVSGAVIVVGPVQISGVGPVGIECASAAMQSIDDELALVEDRVVDVDDLWREVLGSAAGGARDTVTLICPSWWPVARVERVGAAAQAWSANAIVLRRAEVQTATTVVEIAPELVVVHAGAQRHVIARVDPPSGVLAAVVACVEGLADVTVDVPAGVGRFGTELVRALRRRGIEVTVADDQTLLRALRGRFDSARRDVVPTRRRPTPRAAAIAVAVLAASALAATAIGMNPDEESPNVTWLVEGRVAVEVPAQWTVERITSGPGSARVQVVSPGNPGDAIHVTQSPMPDESTLEAAAASLSSALAEQPSGVFVDFTARGERAHRVAITYREVRADRRIDWTVVLDGDVRIAIGCQGAHERPGPAELCDRAIGSAHAVRRK